MPNIAPVNVNGRQDHWSLQHRCVNPASQVSNDLNVSRLVRSIGWNSCWRTKWLFITLLLCVKICKSFKTHACLILGQVKTSVETSEVHKTLLCGAHLRNSIKATKMGTGARQTQVDLWSCWFKNDAVLTTTHLYVGLKYKFNFNSIYWT